MLIARLFRTPLNRRLTSPIMLDRLDQTINKRRYCRINSNSTFYSHLNRCASIVVFLSGLALLAEFINQNSNKRIVFKPDKYSNFSKNTWVVENCPKSFIRIKNEKKQIYCKSKWIDRGDYGSIWELESGDKTSYKICKITPLYSHKKSAHREVKCLKYLYQQNPEGFKGIELYPKKVIVDKDGDVCAIIKSKYDGDLIKLFNSSALVPSDAKEVILQITQGIATLHSYQISHGDLKLDNIFFREKNGILRYDIADFGESRKYINKNNMTIRQSFFHFMNKDDWHKENISFSSDVENYLIIMEDVMKKTGKNNFSIEFKEYLQETKKEAVLTNASERLGKIQILTNQ